MHGARAGAPEGLRNGAWRNGGRSSKVLAIQAMERLLLRMAREALEAECKAAVSRTALAQYRPTPAIS
jgi:hypothetical protein